MVRGAVSPPSSLTYLRPAGNGAWCLLPPSHTPTSPSHLEEREREIWRESKVAQGGGGLSINVQRLYQWHHGLAAPLVLLFLLSLQLSLALTGVPGG